MNLYKVLLVDDEQEVIDAVIKKILWEKLGFEVIGYAQNGEEALELAESNMPDVVITDIKMPIMDGLTLSRRLKENYSDIKVIIFSGFEEFEYAREAIKIEVEEYILKPVPEEELIRILNRIKESLDKERNDKINITKLQEYYQKSLPIMRDQFLISLIEGRMSDKQIESYKTDYKINLIGSNYVISVIHMLRGESSDLLEQEIKPELMNVSLKQFVDENLEKNYFFKSFIYFKDVIYISVLDDSDDVNVYTDRLDVICKRVKRILNMNVVAGIGKVYDHLCMMKYSYEGAKNAMFYKNKEEEGQAVYIGEIEPLLDEGFVLYDSNVQEIIHEIKVGDREGMEEQIDKFLLFIKETKRSISQYQVILMGVIAELYKLAAAYKLDMGELFEWNSDVYQRILQIGSLEETHSWLLDTCLQIRNSIRKERMNTAQILINNATKYIRDHYADSSLSIEKLCKILNVSAAYFSTIFKRETGKTVLNYLTDVRMEKAILLLDGSEEKTYIISEMIGYSEPNYFSYVFKKKYGMTPSKYRKNRTE